MFRFSADISTCLSAMNIPELTINIPWSLAMRGLLAPESLVSPIHSRNRTSHVNIDVNNFTRTNERTQANILQL